MERGEGGSGYLAFLPHCLQGHNKINIAALPHPHGPLLICFRRFVHFLIKIEGSAFLQGDDTPSIF